MAKQIIRLTESELVKMVKEAINETSRRQKAARAMNGDNNIRTIAILTSENPRYDDVMSDREKEAYDNDYDLNQPYYGDDNAERRNNLEKHLKVGHYAWFPVKGQYEGKENSYMIYNISLDDALYLGKKYGQQSIIFIDGTHCEYWEQLGDGKFRLTHEREMSQRIDMSDADDFFTQISRAFKFQFPFFDGSDENKEELEEMNNYVNMTVRKRIINESEAAHRLDSCLYAKSSFCRYANRSELYGNNFQWR